DHPLHSTPHIGPQDQRTLAAPSFPPPAVMREGIISGRLTPEVFRGVQHETQAFLGRPLRKVGDTCQIHPDGIGMISACSKTSDILPFNRCNDAARQPAT